MLCSCHAIYVIVELIFHYISNLHKIRIIGIYAGDAKFNLCGNDREK